MSFTAEVKEELVRIKAKTQHAQKAELSGMVQVCGSLELKGQGAFNLKLTTETGSVARTLLKLFHSLYECDTQLIERRSTLHNSRNYLLLIPYSQDLEAILKELGILTSQFHISPDFPAQFLHSQEATVSYLRGLFMAGGYLAKPTELFRCELKVGQEKLAQTITKVLSGYGIRPSLMQRGGSYIIRLKNYPDIKKFLTLIGAQKIAQAFANARAMKRIKNSVNRLVNAEIANSDRAMKAAVAQCEVILSLQNTEAFDTLPQKLKEFCELRLEYPQLSFAELAKHFQKPTSKAATAHCWERLKQIAHV